MSAPLALDRPDQDQLFELLAPAPEPLRDRRRPEVAAGPTLLETLDTAWDALRATGSTACPTCGGRMERVAGVGSCGGCGSRLG
jgi:hypothetical protein